MSLGMNLLIENIRSVLRFSGYPCPLTLCQFLHVWEDDVTSAGLEQSPVYLRKPVNRRIMPAIFIGLLQN